MTVEKELSDKLDSIHKKLNNIQTDVEVIKNTCENRGKNCGERVIALDKLLRGNGEEGIASKVRNLERTSTGKEKLMFFIVGSLVTGTISLLIAMLVGIIE